MDRGFVFSLIRTYMKDIASKMLQAGSINNDSVQLWNLQVRNALTLNLFASNCKNSELFLWAPGFI